MLDGDPDLYVDWIKVPSLSPQPSGPDRNNPNPNPDRLIPSLTLTLTLTLALTLTLTLTLTRKKFVYHSSGDGNEVLTLALSP